MSLPVLQAAVVLGHDQADALLVNTIVQQPADARHMTQPLQGAHLLKCNDLQARSATLGDSITGETFTSCHRVQWRLGAGRSQVYHAASGWCSLLQVQ